MHDCIEHTGYRTKGGYGQVYLKEFGKTVYAHRLAMARIYGWEAIEGFVVMHTCDNPPCVNPKHLRVGTQTANIHDALDKGRMVHEQSAHGTTGRYNNYGCRCEPCKTAKSEYIKAWKSK